MKYSKIQVLSSCILFLFCTACTLYLFGIYDIFSAWDLWRSRWI